MILFPSPDGSNPCYDHNKKLELADLEPCFKWFEEHMEQLPKSMKLGDGITISDVRTTVSNYIRHLRLVNWERAQIYRGEFAMLQWIQKIAKEKLGEE